jgi:hypothetical protein
MIFRHVRVIFRARTREGALELLGQFAYLPLDEAEAELFLLVDSRLTSPLPMDMPPE